MPSQKEEKILTSRLRKAIIRLESSCRSPQDRKILSQFLAQASPTLANDGILPENEYAFRHHATKISAMFAAIHTAISLYWLYLRSNKEPERMVGIIELLERIGKDGLATARLDGSLREGYRLTYPALEEPAE
jgi:hypothetical protein